MAIAGSLTAVTASTTSARLERVASDTVKLTEYVEFSAAKDGVATALSAFPETTMGTLQTVLNVGVSCTHSHV
jgi:hypothetical protein